MNDYCGRFHLVKDMNGDSVFSVSDVSLIIEYLWLLPAKAAVALIQSSEGLASFFEISCSTGASWGGGIFSLFGWLIILSILVAVLDS